MLLQSREGVLCDRSIHCKTSSTSMLVGQRSSHWSSCGFGEKVETEYHYIHHAFEYFARETPDAIAAIHLNRNITYYELNQQADQLAATLTRLGVSSGDRVGLFLQRSIPMLVGILAILKVGAAYVPQDARITPTSQIWEIIKVTSMRVILTLSSLRHAIPVGDGHHCIDVDSHMARKRSCILPDPQVSGRRDRTCFVLFTSGTTGRPNGVQVTHRNVCNILLTEPGGLSVQPGMRVSQILNIAFDMAAWEIFAALTKGATLLIRGHDIRETVTKANVTIATPSILETVEPEECRGMKIVAVAGEPCPKPLADKWSKFCTFYNSCGPTEVTIVNTMHLYKPDGRRMSIGRPIPNTTVYILDEDMKPVPSGEIGEMWVGGDCVTQGYIGNLRLTEERYKPDPYIGNGSLMFNTRDLGRWNSDGDLEHYGRTDDQVKIRGFRVELDSISAALEAVPGIRKAVTLKLDDRNLATFISPKSVDTAAANQAIVNHLPYYCTPSFIHAMEDFPVTARGKTDKRALTILASKIQEGLS